MKISVVVPIYNEAENILELINESLGVLSTLPHEYELILVDDGSIDETYRYAQEQAVHNKRIKLIRLRRNFGQTAAMAAGFDQASGDLVIPMDGDLQNDPADIPLLIENIHNGYDVVSGWRKSRQDKFLSRRLPSILANSLISRMTGVKLHDYGCTMKAYKREVLVNVNLYGELHRFVPALASQVGANVTEVPVNHRPRKAGVSKYGIDRTLRVLLDLITVKFLLKYATKPMQLFGKWAFYSFIIAVISGASTLYMRFFESVHMNRNPLLILAAFSIFAGIQFIAIGLLGELVTRTYHETQSKPVYAIRDIVN